MTDREKAITTLTEHLDHWKRLLSEGICTKDEGERTINALNFAIDSIKVDRAYDLAYEKVDFIEIPDNATNGEVIQTLFPHIKVYEHENGATYSINNEYNFNSTWWNSPYRKK